MKKSYDSYAVIGLGFGDEGKGVSVNSLCQQLEDPLVVRYSGGQQAGHTVTTKDGISHVFSNFGSGTFKGVPTYWSKYCTFDPIGFLNELNVLTAKGFSPLVYIDERSPVTTPYDKFHNRKSPAMQHGTCGVGVGATFAREEKFYSLTVGDLRYKSVLEMKLKLIADHYNYDADLTDFLHACNLIRNAFPIVDEMPKHKNVIFEGSQGLLLDQNIGFFPHVTRSNVGTKNILEMGYNPRLFLITRAFQTRHGNGPMTNVGLPHKIKHNPNETNIMNQYQGEFKKSILDLDLLKYGMGRDPYIKNSSDIDLVITCLDLVDDDLRFTINGNAHKCHSRGDFITNVTYHLGAARVHVTASPDGVFAIKDFNENR